MMHFELIRKGAFAENEIIEDAKTLDIPERIALLQCARHGAIECIAANDATALEYILEAISYLELFNVVDERLDVPKWRGVDFA